MNMAQIWRKFSKWPAVGGVALLLVAALASPAAAGTTYNVATVAELQSAIALVNAGTGGDLIVLTQPFYSVTGPLTTIFQDVTIQGDPLSPTVILGDDGAYNIFSVRANNVSFQNLTIQHGRVAISYEGQHQFSATGLTVTDNRYGIYLGDNGGASFITNSTIANNIFGIQIDCAALNLTNATITGNQVGISFSSCGELMLLTNSLIVGNAFDCNGSGITPAANASFDSDGTCVALHFDPGVTTQSLAAIGLDVPPVPAGNGGPTFTVAIPATSVAVNTGFNALCPAIDQRGFLRNDGACDIGAYEYGASAGGGGNTQPSSPPGSPVTVSPAPGVTVTFTEVTSAGDTTATTGGPAPPPNFVIDGVVYEISTTAGVTPPMEVCLPYNALTNPSPVVIHYESSGWQPYAATVSPNHLACITVGSLSPFAVVMPMDVAGQLQQLQGLVESFNLRKPVAKRFAHRLDKALAAWADKHHHKHSARDFCKDLDKFMRDVEKATGTTLTAAEAAQLLTLSQLIAGEVGCGS
jgi:hypothetical protein